MSQISGPSRTGVIMGLGYGVAVSTLLLFRMGGFFLILPFVGFAPLLLGPFAGWLLARVGVVPNVDPAPAVCLAVVIAVTPYIAGTVEMRQRGFPFSIPPDVQVTQWEKHPWGESFLTVESADEVPVFLDRLVSYANESGWRCRKCVYQPMTQTGHASFVPQDATVGQARGSMGFEVWPGELALYATDPSEESVARIAYHRPTRSPFIVIWVLSTLLVATVGFQVALKLFPKS